jgi:histidyl-tRNA synthetase
MGLAAIIDLNKRDMRKQLEYANKLNSQFALIVGQKEFRRSKIRLRDMKTGEEKEIDIREIKDL